MEEEDYDLVIIGIVSVVLFVGTLCIVILFKCDTNCQERRNEDEAIAYLADDDRWYPGTRLYHPDDRTNVSFWRGKRRIKSSSGVVFWTPVIHTIALKNICTPIRVLSPLVRCRPATDLMDGRAPLVGNLMRTYTPLWSFTLSQTIIALSTALGFEVRFSNDMSDISGFFVIYGITFVSGLGIMLLFHFCFGFGAAMLAPKPPKVLSRELCVVLFGNIRLCENEAMVMVESNQAFGPRLRFNYISKIYLQPRTHRAFG